tara:strand:- start:510 stop:815 length:306 start_codon:yes stop_codon:yes gene_type:complete
MNTTDHCHTSGKIVYKSDKISFNSAGKDFSYIEMAIVHKHNDEERMKAFKVWDDKQYLIENADMGDFVEVKLTLNSEQNKKHQGVWYHKVFLKDLKIIVKG